MLMDSGAIFGGSERSGLQDKPGSRRFRYLLWRKWSDGPVLTGILLNPSKAGETRDDNTVRFLTGWAMRSGYGMLRMLNLFALVDTDPAGLRTAPEIIGPRNDEYIRTVGVWGMGNGDYHETVLVAWGTHGGLIGRDACVLGMLSHVPLQCFGHTKDGYPRFPRALPRDVELETF